MDKQTKQVEDFWKTYLQAETNRFCFDCGAPNPLWASINNGVMICLSCISTHRTLTLAISLVRSTQLDIWTEKQLSLMENGGNRRLSEFLERYDLAKEEIKVKYTTIAAQYYRKRLASLANNIPLLDEEPEYEAGRKMIDGKSLEEKKLELGGGTTTTTGDP